MTIVVENLDPMVAAVGDQKLILFIAGNKMWILELTLAVSQSPEFSDIIPVRLKNLNPVVILVANVNEPLLINDDPPGAAEPSIGLPVGSKFAQKSPVGIENLNAMVVPVSDHKLFVFADANSGQAIKFPVATPITSETANKLTFLVKNLNPMVTAVANANFVRSRDAGDPSGPIELTIITAFATEFQQDSAFVGIIIFRLRYHSIISETIKIRWNKKNYILAQIFFRFANGSKFNQNRTYLWDPSGFE